MAPSDNIGNRSIRAFRIINPHFKVKANVIAYTKKVSIESSSLVLKMMKVAKTKAQCEKEKQNFIFYIA